LQDVEDLLARAMEKRTVGCTQLNEQSSRSHAVFTLRIEGVNDSSKLKVRPKTLRLGAEP
jgi:kinesin family protein C1